MTSIYVLEAQGGLVKIGIANDLRARLAQNGEGPGVRLRAPLS